MIVVGLDVTKSGAIKRIGYPKGEDVVNGLDVERLLNFGVWGGD